MKKKVISSFLAALMIAGASSISAFAATANGSVVIGSKSFDLSYANDTKNSTEIANAIVEGGAIYVKDFSGNWIDNTTGKTVNASIIPGEVVETKALTYEEGFDLLVSKVKPSDGANLYKNDYGIKSSLYNGEKVYCYNESTDDYEICEYLVNPLTKKIIRCNQGIYEVVYEALPISEQDAKNIIKQYVESQGIRLDEVLGGESGFGAYLVEDASYIDSNSKKVYIIEYSLVEATSVGNHHVVSKYVDAYTGKIIK
ncbi:PepSY domain-containing protein [Clostridium estertheticum]|uniref:PepSY domain-containing protein n=1 Tax=Clostridium estertheticum TaxID=238834 RepID=A0A7Y3SWE2_9CLOT|nr:PepSY domain-containing protein [Clostridium estertheticum]NNU76566.1 hypothetical protein [Clostridium estertheticum]WBL49708.1 PepSY domain-containing protein [Clostridium estertheticum]